MTSYSIKINGATSGKLFIDRASAMRTEAAAAPKGATIELMQHTSTGKIRVAQRYTK